jgi:hypothetical protein
VDEFYRPDGNVSITSTPSFEEPIGWKVAIPSRYTAGNPITMRVFLYWLGPDPTQPKHDCDVFRLAAVRLRSGWPLEVYGQELHVRLTLPPAAQDQKAPFFFVMDLPINAPEGLNFPNDLAAGQVVAFGMEWVAQGCPLLGRRYQIYGVEFFEGEPGSASLHDATISVDHPDCSCGGGGDS